MLTSAAMDDPKFNQVMALEANREKPLERAIGRRRSGFTRNDVVDALQNAFRMTGGTTRLALWANENYTEFMRIYAKLLPSTSLHIGTLNEVHIRHTLPPSALDHHPGYAPPVFEVEEVEEQRTGTEG